MAVYATRASSMPFARGLALIQALLALLELCQKAGERGTITHHSLIFRRATNRGLLQGQQRAPTLVVDG